MSTASGEFSAVFSVPPVASVRPRSRSRSRSASVGRAVRGRSPIAGRERRQDRISRRYRANIAAYQQRPRRTATAAQLRNLSLARRAPRGRRNPANTEDRLYTSTRQGRGGRGIIPARAPRSSALKRRAITLLRAKGFTRDQMLRMHSPRSHSRDAIITCLVELGFTRNNLGRLLEGMLTPAAIEGYYRAAEECATQLNL